MLLRSTSTPGLARLFSHQETAREADLECDSLPPCRVIGRSMNGQTVASSVDPTLAYHSSQERAGRREMDLPKSRIRRVRSEGDISNLRKAFACKSSGNSLITQSVDDDGQPGGDSAVHRQWCKRLQHGSHSGWSDKCSGSERHASMQGEIRENNLEAASVLNAEGVPVPAVSLLNEETAEDSHSYKRDMVAEESTTSGRRLENLRMENGEVYTSFAIAVNGLPVVCTSKGCRPLTGSEKLSPMYMENGGFGGGLIRNKVAFGVSGSDCNNMESYYKKLLLVDPVNPLVLQNFAQFLYEVKHDKEQAEEYYERAILAAPSDGDLLSQYAHLLWNVHKDHDRAELYYKQAVNAAPDDSNVQASYASFLWDIEENEQVDPSLYSQKSEQFHPTMSESTLVASA